MKELILLIFSFGLLALYQAPGWNSGWYPEMKKAILKNAWNSLIRE